MRWLRTISCSVAVGILAGGLRFSVAPAGPALTKKSRRLPEAPPAAGSLGVTVQVLATVPVPKRFHLEQNYPNPFNSSTVISYTSVAGTELSIKIYNILGQEVATVVTGRQPAGNREVVERSEIVWDAVDRKGKPLPSGIYLCQMVAGTHVETKKLVLLR